MSPTSYRAAPPRGNSVATVCSVEDLNVTDYFFICQAFRKNIFCLGYDDASFIIIPSTSMTTDSVPDTPPVISAEDTGFDMTPPVSADEEHFKFSTVCRSRGLSPRLVLSGYERGAFPWPDAADMHSGLYPWGRLFPCTVLKTGRVSLTHSMKKRVRDAVRGHYNGLELEILLDSDFDELIEAVADYHLTRSNGTWMTRELIDTWKVLHKEGHAHSVSVYLDGELSGGLYFTSVGRMLYGESMFSIRPDASKLALAALAAFGGIAHLPVIDCQMPTEHVIRMGAVVLEGKSFLELNQALASLPVHSWERTAGISLLPFLEAVYPEYIEEPSADQPEEHERRIAHAGGMIFETICIANKCSYYEDGRKSTMEIVPLPSNDERVTPMYNRLIDEGFRRDSTYLYRLTCKSCRRCIPTRIDVTAFVPDDTMRRTMKRNASLVMRELPLSSVTEEQYALYRRYQTSRHQDGAMGRMTREEVTQVLFSTCTNSKILEFRTSPDADCPNELKMVCIIDCLDEALSAVYTFFDPDVPKLSLGTFGILSEIEYARRSGLRYVYLGYWLPGYPGMDYKKRFQPMDIFWENNWMPEHSFNADLKILDPNSL